MWKYTRQECGRSMVDLVGVLSVMGLLTAGAFVLITSTIQSQKISRVQDDVANIAMTIRNMSSVGHDFSNLDCGKTLCDDKDILETLQIQTATPFGGQSYYSIVYNQKYPDVFGVRINKIDDKYCKSLNVKTFKDAVSGGCGFTYKIDPVQQKESININEKLSPVVEPVVQTKSDFFSIYFAK